MAFTTTRPLGFGDCDPSGIAFFPAYLVLLVGVLEAFFADLGFPWPALMSERRIATPTVRLDLTFSAPGFHGDLLEFALLTRAVGRSSLDLEHEIAASGRLLWRARHRVVATSMDTHAAVPWPADLRAVLLARLETP